MNQKISLGLDIGVSSVGFSVIDYEAGKILELGSRLFNGKIAEENVVRRDMRGSRRLTGWKKQRRQDTIKLFHKYNLLGEADLKQYSEILDSNQNSYQIRVKGLSEKLSAEELVIALFHIVKKRGISYDLQDAEIEDDDSGSDYGNALRINTLQLKKMFPAEIQLERLERFKAVRGQIKIEDEESRTVLLNVFPTKEYVKEAKKIIEQQSQFYPEVLTDDFVDSYLSILQRKRDYFVGPGSEKSRTDYGIYKKDGRTLDNLFEELIGKCSVYEEELRASGASYTAQYFNLLNDLNNLRISTREDQRLTTEDKAKIIEEILDPEKKSIQMMRIIKKVADCTDYEIKGFRIDDKGKPDLHSMAVYRKFRRSMIDAGIDFSKLTHEFIDDLSFTMTLNTENGEIRKQLLKKSQNYDFLTEELIQAIIDNKTSMDIKSNNKWHRFSLKLMNQLIPDMTNRSIEQMTLINELGLRKKDDNELLNTKFIPYRQIAKEIFSPVASKSVREALKIVNAVLKKYGHIDYLVVEMPRDKNEDEAKKKIEQFQKENRTQKDKALESFTRSVGSKKTVEDALARYSGKLYFKIHLWYQQDGIDLYNG